LIENGSSTFLREVDRESFGAQAASYEFSQLTIILDNEYSHKVSLQSTLHTEPIRGSLEHH
jgi:hypothetical protein